MLSPYKLYKHDQKFRRHAVTDGPEGKPRSTSSRDASPCYRHPNVDWTVHRLVPAIQDREMRRHHGAYGPISHAMHKAASAVGMKGEAGKQNLLNTSPRWGLGMAKGRTYYRGPHKSERYNYRKVAPLPKPGQADISRKTYAVVGGVAAAGVGYEAYKHRKQIAGAAHKVEQSFHHSRFYHTIHHHHGTGAA